MGSNGLVSTQIEVVASPLMVDACAMLAWMIKRRFMRIAFDASLTG